MTGSYKIVVPEEMPQIMFLCTIICLECFLISLINIRTRFTTYTKEHMA